MNPRFANWGSLHIVYLGDLFKGETGRSLQEYIIQVKMERAKQLALDESMKTYEIAYHLGYESQDYFCKLFRRHTGLSISEFRANNQ